MTIPSDPNPNLPSKWVARALASTGRFAVKCYRQAGREFDELLFPAYCPVCDVATGGPAFCRDCRGELLGAAGSRCFRCASPVGPFEDRLGGCSECRGRPLGFDRAVTLGPYQGPIRHLCLNLKHEKNGWMARWMAELVVQAHRETLRGEAEGGPEGRAWVVPVPLHWTRRLVRGYNQADDLAVGLARKLSLKVRRPLRRVVATPKLAAIGRTERARIMKDAFLARPSKALQGRTIILVDDILTSGSTCGAAARALKKAGASRVVVAVVARAEGKP